MLACILAVRWLPTRSGRTATGSGSVRRTRVREITILVWGLLGAAERATPPRVPDARKTGRSDLRKASDLPTGPARGAHRRCRQPRAAPVSPKFGEFAATKRDGNFPGCKPLKSRETRKESRSAPAPSRAPAIAGRAGRIRVRRTRRDETARKFSWLQAIEKSRNAEGISLFPLPIGESSVNNGSGGRHCERRSEAIQTEPQMRSPSLDGFALLAVTDRARSPASAV